MGALEVYFSYIAAVIVIILRNQSIERKLPTCQQATDKLYRILVISSTPN
jgi:hypothetical protein